ARNCQRSLGADALARIIVQWPAQRLRSTPTGGRVATVGDKERRKRRGDYESDRVGYDPARVSRQCRADCETRTYRSAVLLSRSGTVISTAQENRGRLLSHLFYPCSACCPCWIWLILAPCLY